MNVKQQKRCEEDEILQDILNDSLDPDFLKSEIGWQRIRAVHSRKYEMIELQRWIEICRERERLFIKSNTNQ